MKPNSISATISMVAAMFAAIVTILLPTSYWWINHRSQLSEITATAKIHSLRVTEMVNRNPLVWRFEAHRLSSLVNTSLSSSELPEIRSVLDLEGNVLARSPGHIDEPSVAYTEFVYDSGNPVGVVAVQRSTLPLLHRTIVVALLGLVLGLTLFIILRILPLRALSHAHSSLHREKERLRIVVDHALDPIISMSQGGIVESFNAAAEKSFGYRAKHVIGKHIQTLMPGFEPGHTILAHEKAKTGETVEGVARRRNRTLFPVEYALSSTNESANGKLICILRDITERKQAQQSMVFNAHYDSLTHLPNRALFRDRLAHAVVRARRHEKLAALMFLDLDRFKMINDSLGHAVGDLLLQAVAKRLSETLRAADTVSRHIVDEALPGDSGNAIISRLGGDEFTVILEELNHVNDAAVAAQKIIQAMTIPFELSGHVVYVTTSIGITLFPLDDSDIDTLIKHADVAMYLSKQSGRNDYHFYSKEMNNCAHERLSMETALRAALDKKEFYLHYQPKVNLATGLIVGVEALLRWQNEKFPQIDPEKFIPVLEEMGLIGEVGDWVLRTACTQMQTWQKQGLPAFMLAVNLSARQFREKDIAERIENALHLTGIAPNLLELEMTESLLMDHSEATCNTLAALSRLGIKIALDDFGTGYSSLAYLKRFPINALKIDRSFVVDLATNPNDVAITKAIIALAHSLQMNVIAEGVETETQRNFLQQQGCDQIQGYLISRPLSPQDMELWINKMILKQDHKDDLSIAEVLAG
ncbi:MAG: EAL domain-containing protein [Pseudomonadota bacterium]